MIIDLSFLPQWPPRLDNAFWFALLLVAAPLVGEAVFRSLRWPRIVGYALVGLAASAISFDSGGLQLPPAFQRAMEVALAVLLFELGSRIHLRWILANPWLIAGSLAEAGLSFGLVLAGCLALGIGTPSALAIATISLATSPAVIMRVTAEMNARGQVTERLLLFSALNTVYAVTLMHLLPGFLAQTPVWTPPPALLWNIFGSILLAALLAAMVGYVQRTFDLREENGGLLLLGMLFLNLALIHQAGASPLLTPLLAGIMLHSIDPRPRLWPRHFGTAGGILVVLLFVVSGLSTDWRLVAAGGLTGLLLLLLRTVGKLGGCLLFGRSAGISLRQSTALGTALLPMSGIAFLLSASLHATLPEISHSVAAALAGAILITEIAGPLCTQWALRISHEAEVADPPRGGSDHA